MTAWIDTPAGTVRAGDVLTYLAFGGTPRTCRVTAVYADVKNGEAGFDAIKLDIDGRERTGAHNGGRVWGYARQVVAVDPA